MGIGGQGSASTNGHKAFGLLDEAYVHMACVRSLMWRPEQLSGSLPFPVEPLQVPIHTSDGSLGATGYFIQLTWTYRFLHGHPNPGSVTCTHTWCVDALQRRASSSTECAVIAVIEICMGWSRQVLSESALSYYIPYLMPWTQIKMKVRRLAVTNRGHRKTRWLQLNLHHFFTI